MLLKRLGMVSMLSLALASSGSAQPAVSTPPPTPLAIGRCLWESLPKATRDALDASGPAVDDISRALNNINPSLMDVARAQCPSPTDSDQAHKATDAWVALALQSWAETQLYKQHKITSAAVADAWRRFTPDERRQFEANEDKPPDAERANVAPMAKTLGLTADGDLDLVAFWVLCQLHLTALGG